MASAGAPVYNGGVEAQPQRSEGPGGTACGVRGRSPAEAGGILVHGAHIFFAVLELVVVADLTEATRQRRTFVTSANLSVND